MYTHDVTGTYIYLYICIIAFSQSLVNCGSSLRSVDGLFLNRT